MEQTRTRKLNELRPDFHPLSAFKAFVPFLYENGDYVLPSRRSTLLEPVKSRFRKERFLVSPRFAKRLRELGLSDNFITQAQTLRVSKVLRMEQYVHSVMDALLLSIPEIFRRDRHEMPLIKRLVRTVFCLSMRGEDRLMRDWKQFTNYILTTKAKALLAEPAVLARYNVFRPLLSSRNLNELILQEETKKSWERCAHLISTRHFPNGSSEIEREARKAFRDVVTSSFEVSEENLRKIRFAAREIGRRVRRDAPASCFGDSHFSLAAAGSLNRTSSEGGRAQEILEAIKEYLLFVPEVPAVIQSTIGPLQDVPGIPRWRTWCRPEAYNLYTEDCPTWGDSIKETLGGYFVYRQGLDEVLGHQIYAIAELEFIKAQGSENPRPSVRVLTVSEPGGKARIVTTGPWWLYVLEQPVSHVMRALLSSHPSAIAGLVRADQAWQYLRMLERAKDHLPEGYWCLSSDLKSATDAIPISVIRETYIGFWEGVRNTNYLLTAVLRLLEVGRTCIDDDETYHAVRGIFMGEPMAKPILTLVNLVYEEVAMREYFRYNQKVPIHVPWRCFACAGDDHIAVGPLDYLQKITAMHIACGSIISPTKHMCSQTAVQYCEKILQISLVKGPWKMNEINNSTESYEASPFVDSVKVRLISPSTKGNETFNEKNVAVGKGIQLGRTLQWLNRDHFPRKWVSMVRDRFFSRMQALLPGRKSGVYWHLLLPTVLGGLGLGLTEDLEDIALRVPDPTKSLIAALSRGERPESLKDFQALTSNASYRGYSQEYTEVGSVCQLLIKLIGEDGERVRSFQDLCRERPHVKDLGPRAALRILEQEGWATRQSLEEGVKRAFLFRDILTEVAEKTTYNTIPLKRRYKLLWDLYYKGSPEITSEDVKRAMKLREFEPLYSFKETISLPYRGSEIQVNAKQEVVLGLPHLAIKWPDIHCTPLKRVFSDVAWDDYSSHNPVWTKRSKIRASVREK